jgi:Tol biopolymer transport system component
VLGQKLGRFTILEQIGQGGMGVVYRAHDTRLGRDVALKVLPPDRVADPERRRRFEHEARAASALQHPNIVTIHDITQEDGRDLIVMELVSGQTLDRLIGRKGLKLGRALGYAIQIADGLAKAHTAGILHRDLKPSNIMVTGDGIVKILDFGLAKLFERESPDAAAPTATTRLLPDGLTDDGAIVGTAAYMSPEQAEGKPLDSRSDVFAFGSVLYEMITGRRAFQRDTSAHTLAAIAADEPETAGRVVGDLPPELERAIARCLRKDPQRRWQSMSDLRVVLQDLKEDSDSGTLRPVAAIPRRRGRLGWWAAGAVVLAATAVAVVWWMTPPPSPGAGIVVTRMTFDAGRTLLPAITQDGRLFAYTSDRAQPGDLDIWVQQIAGGQPLRLTDHPVPDWAPSFSPDGSRVAFRSERDGGGLYIVDALGGEARRLVDHGFFPLFSPDGSQICYVDIPGSLDPAMTRMGLVGAQGGPSQLFHPELSVYGAGVSGHPIWSPDGKYVLVMGSLATNLSAVDWWIAPVDGGPVKRVGAVARLALKLPVAFPRAWTADFVYYESGTTVEGINLFRVPFDVGRLEISGAPETLTVGAGMKWLAALGGDGRMVFSQMTWTANVWGVTARADDGAAAGEPAPITQDETVKFGARISRDGSTLAYTAFSGTRGAEVRIRALASGRETAVSTTQGLLDRAVVLSADGSVVAYRRPADGRTAFFVRPVGSADERAVCDGCVVRAFFADSNLALVQYGTGELVRQNLSTGDRTMVLRVDDVSILDAGLSRDDRWIAWLAGLPNGHAAIFVSPLQSATGAPEARILVREDNRVLSSPRWSPNGEWLYYLSSADGYMCVWGQRLDPASRKPVGAPVGIVHVHGRMLMHFPLSLAPLEVAADRLALILGEARGNIYMAQLDRW